MRPLARMVVVIVVGGASLVPAARGVRADAPDVPEPAHAGRTLAAWVEELSAPQVERRRAAAFEVWALRRDLVPHVATVARACADVDPYVRTTVGKAIESLGFRGAAAFPVLLRAYAEAAPDGREALAAPCAATMPAVVGAEEVARVRPWVRDATGPTRALALRVLRAAGRAAGPEATQAVHAALAADEPDADVVADLRATLATLDPVGSLASDDREQRLAALTVLDAGPSSFPADVVAGVVAAMADPEDDVRAAAVVVLSSVLLGNDPAARALAGPAAVDAWARAPRGSARTYVPLCLARAAKDHPPALAALREALASTDDVVAEWALLGARELDPVPDDVVAVALRGLRPPASAVRRAAAANLLGVAGAGPVESVVPALAVALLDDAPDVRRAAGGGLAARGAADPAVAAIVRAALVAFPDYATEDGALAALGVVGTGTPDDVATARRLLTSARHPAVRLAASELVLRWAWDAGDDARAALGVAALADEPFARSAAWGVVGALVTAKRPVGPWVRALLPAGASPRLELRHALLRVTAGDADAALATRLVELLTTIPDLSTTDEGEAAPVVDACLVSPQPAVRAAGARAFRALGFAAEPSGPKLASLAATDPDPAVRAAAAGTVAVLRRRGMTVPEAAAAR